MSALKSLVPARFLTLAAHLVVVITIFWSRNNNIQSCLPLEFTEEQFKTEDTRLLVALSVTLGLFVIELAGFLSGVSMFNSNQAVLLCFSERPVSSVLSRQRLRQSVLLCFPAVAVLDVLDHIQPLQCDSSSV
ncbi:transmembrane protein 107 isoform X2 [Labeo rohita]|uniref:transmembrane protein 107 isoform X2 n=1 Tax=Labeo rohita TaxID=84645 RepID=UPI0021E2984F|nr:transmembrane protein 107 isoform X2 [Labeo rohita]